MKKSLFQIVFAVASVAAGSGYPAIASAHSETSALGSGANKTDFFQANCFTNGGGTTDHIVIHVLDAAPKKSPKLSVQAFKGSVAANSTDRTDGDDSYGPEVKVSGGDGVYYIAVDKTAAAPENYVLEYHCQSSTNSHTGTGLTQLQDQ